LAVVLGSRKPFAVFHSSLNPLPALTMNIWFSVCKKGPNSEVKKMTLLPNCYQQFIFAVRVTEYGMI